MPPASDPPWIASFVEGVVAGRPPVGLVVAPDLSGRREVLDAVAAAVARPVVLIEPLEFEAETPFAALAAVIDETVTDARSARSAVVRHCAGSIVLVDDAHWLDAGSVQVLTALVARPGDDDVGVVVAHRPLTGAVPSRAPLTALADAVGARGPVLRTDGVLDRDEVAARLAVTTGRPAAAERVELVVELTAGRVGLVDLVADDAGSAPSVGPAVTEAIRTRLDRLAPITRDLVGLMALAPHGPDDVWSVALGIGVSELPDLLAEGHAAGLLLPGHEALVPLVASVCHEITSEAETRDRQRRLGEAAEGRGSAVAAAERLAAAGASGPDAAAAFARAGDEVLNTEPAAAAGWYERAIGVGADSGELHVARAEAAARLGQTTAALEFADQVKVPDHRARAALITAAITHRRGLTGRALTLLAEAAAAGDAVAPTIASPLALGQGRVGGAPLPADESSLVSAAVGTLATAAATALADPGASLAEYLEAAALLDSAHSRPVLPELPHILGASTALVAGDAAVAAQLLERANREQSGEGLHEGARTAWTAWSALSIDVTASAVEGPPTEGRDAMVLVAAEAARARRAGDLVALHEIWTRAEPLLIEVEVDVWLLEPVAELAASAGRLDPRGRSLDRLDVIAEQLGRLHASAPWMAVLEWSRVQIGVATDRVDLVREGAASLAALPALPPSHEALRQAAEAWTRILADDIDEQVVVAAAAALETSGRAWDASRLVGQAAIRTTDQAVARALLGRARQLYDDRGASEPDATALESVLSEREIEVARLVIDGRTHKEIGAQLYVSPKTVEHHVARIRQKLGASTRAEMLAALRRELGT